MLHSGYLAQAISDNPMGYDSKNIVYVGDPIDYEEMCGFAKVYCEGSVECSIIETISGPYFEVARFMFSNAQGAKEFRDYYNLEG